MIKDQWYAVMSSHHVKKNKVVAVRRFGKDLVFFRTDAGEVSLVEALCAHRGASLASGWVEDCRIKCPFHGIEYDSTGKCVHVPSEGRQSTLDFSRFNLKHYPTYEAGGIIFAWYGEGKPVGEPDYFDIITDPSFSYDHMEDTWDIHYSRVIENQLDVSHLPFVHHNTIGRGNKTVCNGPKVVWLDDNTFQTSADNEVDSGQTPGTSEESRIKDTNLTFKFPNMWLNHVSDKIQILAFFIPVDDAHAIIALRFYNRITGIRAVNKAIAWLGSRANKIIERQDKRIVETQLPVRSDTDIGENLVAADYPIVEYRTKRRSLMDGEKKGTFPIELSPEMNIKAMYKLSYGLFVCTAAKGEKKNGCIINTAVQVASDPNRISVAVNKANYTHDMIKETGLFNISVISEDADFSVFKHFGFQSGRDVDKFAEDYPADDYRIAENGIPYIVRGTNAYFSLRVEKEIDQGSHTLFICEPVFMTVLSDAPSCTYEYYQSSIKPRPEKVGETPEGKTVWRCVICGYEWEGEELPDDFICPVCKHPKADFEKVVR